MRHLTIPINFEINFIWTQFECYIVTYTHQEWPIDTLNGRLIVTMVGHYRTRTNINFERFIFCGIHKFMQLYF